MGSPKALFDKAKTVADKNKASGADAGGDVAANPQQIADGAAPVKSDRDAAQGLKSEGAGAQKKQIPKPSGSPKKPVNKLLEEASECMAPSATKMPAADVKRLRAEAEAAKKAAAEKRAAKDAEETTDTGVGEGPAEAAGEQLVFDEDGGDIAITGEPKFSEEEEGEEGEGEEGEEGSAGPENAEAAPGAPEGGEGGGDEGADAGGGDSNAGADAGPEDVPIPPPPSGGGGGPGGGGGGGGGESVTPPSLSPTSGGGGGGSGLGQEAADLEQMALECGGTVEAPTRLSMAPDPAPVKPSDALLSLAGTQANAFLEEKFNGGAGAQDLAQFTQDNDQFAQSVTQLNTHAQTTKNFGLDPFKADDYTPFQGQGFVGGTLETIQAALGGIAKVTGTVADYAAVIGTLCKVAGWILTVLAPPVGAALSAVGNFLTLVEVICNIVSMSCSAINAGIDLVRLVCTDDPRERAKFAKRFAGNVLATVGRGLMAMAGSGTWGIKGAAKFGKATGGVLKGTVKGIGGAGKSLVTGGGVRGALNSIGSAARSTGQSFKGIKKLEDGMKAAGALGSGSKSIATGMKTGVGRIRAGYRSGLRSGGKQAVANMPRHTRRNLTRAVKAGGGDVGQAVSSPGRLRAAATSAAQTGKRARKFAARVSAPTTGERLRSLGTQARGAAQGTAMGFGSARRHISAGFGQFNKSVLATSKPWVQSAAAAGGLRGRVSSIFNSINTGRKELFAAGVAAKPVDLSRRRFLGLPATSVVPQTAASTGRLARGFRSTTRFFRGSFHVANQSKIFMNAASVKDFFTKYGPPALTGDLDESVRRFRNTSLTKEDGEGNHSPKATTVLYGLGAFDKDRSGLPKVFGQKLGLNLIFGSGDGPSGLDLSPRFNQTGTSDAAQRGIDALSGSQGAGGEPGGGSVSETPPTTSAPTPAPAPAAPERSPAPPAESSAPPQSGAAAPAPAPEQAPNNGDLGARIGRLSSLVRQIECYEQQLDEVQQHQRRYEAAVARQQYLSSLPIPSADQAGAPSALGVLDQEIAKLTTAEQEAEQARLAYVEGLQHYTKKSAQADQILAEARTSRETLRAEEAAANAEEEEQKRGKEGTDKTQREQNTIDGEGKKGKSKSDQTKGRVDSVKPGPGPEPPEEDVPWYRIDKHVVNLAKKAWRATVGRAMRYIGEKWAQLKQKLTQMIMEFVLGLVGSDDLAAQIKQAGQQADANLTSNAETKGDIDSSKTKVDEMEQAATTGKTDAERAMQTYAEMIVDAEEAKASATQRKEQVVTWRADMASFIQQFEATYGLTFAEATKAAGEDWSAKNHSNIIQALQGRMGALAQEFAELEGSVSQELEEQANQPEGEEAGQGAGGDDAPDYSAEPSEGDVAPTPAPTSTVQPEQGAPAGESVPAPQVQADGSPAYSPPEKDEGSQETPQSSVDPSQEFINLAQELRSSLGDNRGQIQGELERWNRLVASDRGLDLEQVSCVVLQTYDELAAPMDTEIANIISHLRSGGSPESAGQTLQELAESAASMSNAILSNARSGYIESLQDLTPTTTSATATPQSN